MVLAEGSSLSFKPLASLGPSEPLERGEAGRRQFGRRNHIEGTPLNSPDAAKPRVGSAPPAALSSASRLQAASQGADPGASALARRAAPPLGAGALVALRSAGPQEAAERPGNVHPENRVAPFPARPAPRQAAGRSRALERVAAAPPGESAGSGQGNGQGSGPLGHRGRDSVSGGQGRKIAVRCADTGGQAAPHPVPQVTSQTKGTKQESLGRTGRRAPIEWSRFGVAVAPRTAAEPTGLQQPWPRAPGSPRLPLVFLFFILMLLNYENPSCSSPTSQDAAVRGS